MLPVSKLSLGTPAEDTLQTQYVLAGERW
jgi:hypothetical protein